MSSLQIGIIGLPNVGKSTLFNALTDNDVLAANYPFATVEPNTGIVPVPDERLAVLQKMYTAPKVIPATVTFTDIAGLVAGASTGEGLGNKFLANIRETDAICHVVRAFADTNVQHVNDRVDPKADIDIINTELMLADVQTIENRLTRLRKEAKANPTMKPVANYIERLKDHLLQGTPLHALPNLDYDVIQDMHLLTAKPVMYVFNVDEATLTNNDRKKELGNIVAPAKALYMCAQLEDEIRALDTSEAQEMLAAYNQTEPGLHTLIQVAYDTLGLQSYLTAGPKEVRAWTIKKGSTAPQAAGVIHTDFERGFIAAQVITFHDLVQAGSEAAAKAVGKIRTEGKQYTMKPDDVVEFRFNV